MQKLVKFHSPPIPTHLCVFLVPEILWRKRGKVPSLWMETWMEINLVLWNKISMFYKELHSTAAAAWCGELCKAPLPPKRHPQKKAGSCELIHCFGGCFVFYEMLEFLHGVFQQRGFIHSNLICSLQKPRGSLGLGMEILAQALDPACLRPLWSSGQASPARREEQGWAICQVCRNKLVLKKHIAVILWYTRYSQGLAAHQKKWQLPFVRLLLSFTSYFLPLRLKTSQRRLTRFMAEVYKKRIKTP